MSASLYKVKETNKEVPEGEQKQLYRALMSLVFAAQLSNEWMFHWIGQTGIITEIQGEMISVSSKNKAQKIVLTV